MAAFGLYTHIQSNRRRSIALLTGLFFLVYVLVYAGALAAAGLSFNADLPTLMRIAWIDLIKAAPFATIGTLLWIVIAYYFHQAMIDAVTGGREVQRAEAPRLYNILEDLCISRGLSMPKLKIMETDALNAFATGMNEKQYSITVTTGLLDRLNDAEIEAVLGHELTHIRNGDVRMMVVAVIIAGAVSFFAELIFRLWFYNGFSFRSARGEERRGGGAAIVVAIALLVVAYVLSFVIRLALSRAREYLADAGSVELTKNPDAMISALRKIEGRGELPDATSAVMELCVDNPREGFGELFDTHPSVESRVAALVKFVGGHDPGPLVLADESSEDRSEPAGAAGPWGAAPNGESGTESAPDLSPSGTGENGASKGPWSQPGQDSGPTSEPSQEPSGPLSGPWGPHRSMSHRPAINHTTLQVVIGSTPGRARPTSRLPNLTACGRSEISGWRARTARLDGSLLVRLQGWWESVELRRQRRQ
jgi:heat shock protein HtpX